MVPGFSQTCLGSLSIVGWKRGSISPLRKRGLANVGKSVVQSLSGPSGRLIVAFLLAVRVILNAFCKGSSSVVFGL